MKQRNKLRKGKNFGSSLVWGIFSLVLWHVLGGKQGFLRWLMVICVLSLVLMAFFFSAQCSTVAFLCSCSPHTKSSSSHFVAACTWNLDSKAGEKWYASCLEDTTACTAAFLHKRDLGQRQIPAQGTVQLPPDCATPDPHPLCAQRTGRTSKIKHEVFGD